MDKFTTFAGQIASLNQAIVDAQQILPLRFLNRTEKHDWGQFAFYNWRYLDDSQTLNPDFELNKPEFKDASILLVNGNFEIGNNCKEQVLWSLVQYGIKTIIATKFSLSFYRQAIYNGLLPITVSKEQGEQLLNNIKIHTPYKLTVDLENQTVCDNFGLTILFNIDQWSKKCLQNGLDLVSVALASEKEIEAFENRVGK